MNWWKRSSRRKKERKWFLETGSTFLEELVADCNGKSNPIRLFSSDQILRATNNFHYSCLISEQGNLIWYRGIIDDRVYAIKQYHSPFFPNVFAKQWAYNDTVISVRVGSHGNFLKVLGCCLEFPLPVLVHEYPNNGFLKDSNGGNGGKDISLFPWKLKVKIAKEIAYAVTYLHKAFPRIIIHRGIKPTNICLDKNWTAKLNDFSLSISLPEGKSRVQDIVVGTFDYADPRYLATGVVAESCDVFSFGTFLMVLLTCRPTHPMSEPTIYDYVKTLPQNGLYSTETMEQMMTEEMTNHQRSQMEVFRKLALRCCEDAEDDRPTMIQVAKELKQMERFLDATTSSTGLSQTLRNV